LFGSSRSNSWRRLDRLPHGIAQLPAGHCNNCRWPCACCTRG